MPCRHAIRDLCGQSMHFQEPRRSRPRPGSPSRDSYERRKPGPAVAGPVGGPSKPASRERNAGFDQTAGQTPHQWSHEGTCKKMCGGIIGSISIVRSARGESVTTLGVRPGSAIGAVGGEVRRRHNGTDGPRVLRSDTARCPPWPELARRTGTRCADTTHRAYGTPRPRSRGAPSFPAASSLKGRRA